MREISSKIKTIEELAKILNNFKEKGKKIVHCHGVFDLLHPGHIRYFEAAKKKGDILVVTITKDEYVNKGPDRPYFNEQLRLESVAAIECVDYVALNNWPSAVETIKLLKPHFYVKGKDYLRKEYDLTGKIYEEEEAVKSVGGELFITDEITFSSSSLINTYFSKYPEETKIFLESFKKKYTSKDIINALSKIKDVKILLIGDIIIDEYHYCVGMGKSQKDNIIATKFLNEEVFLGGVLAAGNHLANFCDDITLLSLIGKKNNYKNFIFKHLNPNIKKIFYYSENIPTIIKRRFVDPAFFTKLFEVCYLDDTYRLEPKIEKDICKYLSNFIKKFDMVIVADFGHGLITDNIVDTISKNTNFLAINVQTNSANLGFNLITKFKRADYICIDEPELRLACHDKFSKLEDLILNISKKLKCKNIIITRGHRGSICYSKKDGFIEIPVFSTKVLDRIGAGDAFFSITSPCVFKNNPLDLVGFIGNAVGALKVLIVGNRSPVEKLSLFRYITTLLK